MSKLKISAIDEEEEKKTSPQGATEEESKDRNLSSAPSVIDLPNPEDSKEDHVFVQAASKPSKPKKR
jgi:hypothetical protein